jgi:D-arabinono-1,4-lactone oxidase
VEWFVFGMQYGFKADGKVTEAVETARRGLLMDCLYSQFVNEWALPLEKGPEAITRLSAWINGDEKTAQIPFSSKGVYIHCPIEVRVSDTTLSDSPRPYLDPTSRDGPTLYLNATLYRPYLRDPPCVHQYYEAFEWLMRSMGAKPHWAKNFETGRKELHDMYGADMDAWLAVRKEVDVDGMFVGEWHQRNLLPEPAAESSTEAPLPLQEREKTRRRFGAAGAGDGLEWIGDRRWELASERRVPTLAASEKEKESTNSTPSPPMTATSEESFDLLAHGEASLVLPPPHSS